MGIIHPSSAVQAPSPTVPSTHPTTKSSMLLKYAASIDGAPMTLQPPRAIDDIEVVTAIVRQ
jgi:hypothetical protein